uniref:Uncharacterized protein n=1 Tax=Chromera velia CCMP2878 TaxID=1169474 RepID=A0A0G4F4M3_9ALVE|mmetsp:Transcript_47524/g.93737  ORF Transcript_47524/g.93737 Transcript_47524/m.93737 type:complete len:296 (+) Transcript_47524:352-1239(+)|eukprot:Cvel_15108.t1-p1 / transcript=Cvel_15108.t1 / gene=Cvel_15108 / organism=Chromera_velia_CCMP2878 / gene_product=Thioredoxin-related transmembrane protein 2, putative / transcript_product=Thioredoxin-related transmembrane protein 2, putative / location=Cvel_scaffold1102:48586-51857(+) / protein_length=295 / sequence_SO=supercontig / SO=protein_coding / is_pseudo=false
MGILSLPPGLAPYLSPYFVSSVLLAGMYLPVRFYFPAALEDVARLDFIWSGGGIDTTLLLCMSVFVYFKMKTHFLSISAWSECLNYFKMVVAMTLYRADTALCLWYGLACLVCWHAFPHSLQYKAPSRVKTLDHLTFDRLVKGETKKRRQDVEGSVAPGGFWLVSFVSKQLNKQSPEFDAFFSLLSLEYACEAEAVWGEYLDSALRFGRVVVNSSEALELARKKLKLKDQRFIPSVILFENGKEIARAPEVVPGKPGPSRFEFTDKRMINHFDLKRFKEATKALGGGGGSRAKAD